MKYLIYSLYALATMSVAALAQETRPDAHNTALADVFCQAAKAATNADQALAAARKALEADAEHPLGNVLLADALANKGDRDAAVKQLATAEAVLARAGDAPAEVKTKLQAVRDRLVTPGKLGPRWEAIKKDFANRYARLGEEQAGNGLLSTHLAFVRACMLRPNDSQLTGQRDRSGQGLAKVPAAAEKADPEGAKLLHGQADKNLSAGQYDQALPLFKAVVSLDAGDADAWCDLGTCCLKGKEKNAALATACLMEARTRLGDEPDDDADKKLDARIRQQLAQADPRMDKLTAIDQVLLALCKPLIADATKADDKVTAEQAAATVSAVTGQSLSVDSAGPGPIQAGEWVNLLDYVDVRKDYLAYATFAWREDALLASGGSYAPPPRLVFPLTVEGDYEVRVEIEWPGKSKDILAVLCLPVGRESVRLIIRDTSSVLSQIQGASAIDKKNPTVFAHPKLTTDKKYTVYARVTSSGRSARVETRLDDRPFVRWEGATSALAWVGAGGCTYDRPLVNQKCLALSALATETLYHKVEMRLGRGKATLLRSPAPYVSGSGNLAGRIDLSSRDIDVQSPAQVKVTRNRDHILIEPKDVKSDGNVRLTLGNLKFAENTRAVWKVEVGGEGGVRAAFGPGWTTGGLAIGKTAVGGWQAFDCLKAAGCEVWTEAADKFAEATRRDGNYTVCFERLGNVQNCWVNSIKVMEAKMPDDLMNAAKRMPQDLLIGCGQKCGTVKLTLTELYIGKDAPPYPPPAATQPAGTP
ncbi:MAG: tetratricopeptide repeat protein [Phycisphaerae bacterium]|nr:tetratricopeptide repeat protein [Phycisphaerae bacterium]